MDYAEETAKEIIQKFNLSPTTLKVWKTRGKIPERYSIENFKIRKRPLDEYNISLSNNIKKILEYGKINISSLCRLTKLQYNTLSAFIYKTGFLTDEELLNIKKAINQMRIEVRSILNDLNLTYTVNYSLPSHIEAKIVSFLKREEICMFLFFERNKEIYSKFERHLKGARSFPNESLSHLENYLAIFYTETTLN